MTDDRRQAVMRLAARICKQELKSGRVPSARKAEMKAVRIVEAADRKGRK